MSCAEIERPSLTHVSLSYSKDPCYTLIIISPEPSNW